MTLKRIIRVDGKLVDLKRVQIVEPPMLSHDKESGSMKMMYSLTMVSGIDVKGSNVEDYPDIEKAYLDYMNNEALVVPKVKRVESEQYIDLVVGSTLFGRFHKTTDIFVNPWYIDYVGGVAEYMGEDVESYLTHCEEVYEKFVRGMFA